MTHNMHFTEKAWALFAKALDVVTVVTREVGGPETQWRQCKPTILRWTSHPAQGRPHKWTCGDPL